MAEQWQQGLHRCVWVLGASAVLMGASAVMAQETAGVSLEALSVAGTPLSRYDFDQASSATGFIADVDDLPRSVQVLPEQLILDQNASNLTDVLVNAPGVTRSHGFGGATTQVAIRGFVNNHLFVDGNPVSPQFNIDVVNLERVEVVQGPASILHGQVSPGGVINLITKRPQAVAAHSIQAEVDQQGKQRLVLDTTGPLNDSLNYRLVVSAEESETFREVSTPEGDVENQVQRYSVSPSFSYQPNERNRFTLRFSQSEQRLPIDRGTVAVQGADGVFRIADIPEERSLATEFDQRDSRDRLIQFDFEHEFANGWSNRFKLGRFEKSFDDFQARPAAGLNALPTRPEEILALINTRGVQENGLLLRTADSNLDVTEEDFFISNSLIGDFDLWTVSNTLYFGINYYQRDLESADGFALQDASAIIAPGVFVPQLTVIDIFADQQAVFSLPEQTTLSRSEVVNKELGISFQNLAYLTDRLNLLLGLRYDEFEQEREDQIFMPNLPGQTLVFSRPPSPQVSQINSKNDNISGQVGLIYDVTDEVSIFSSYSESFLPNYPELTAGGLSSTEALAPEEAAQVEIGVKASLLQDKLRLNASLYKIKRENVLTFIGLVPRLNGEVETQGFELSSSMQFTPGLNVLASYTYLDSEIIEDDDAGLSNEGNRPFSIPDNKARLWGSYEFQQGDLVGLGLALGAEYVSERFGDDANTFSLPSYTLLDTAAWYYLPVAGGNKLRLQAGIKNLTDKRYFPANGSNSAFRINVGDPRTFYVSARLEF